MLITLRVLQEPSEEKKISLGLHCNTQIVTLSHGDLFFVKSCFKQPFSVLTTPTSHVSQKQCGCEQYRECEYLPIVQDIAVGCLFVPYTNQLSINHSMRLPVLMRSKTNWLVFFVHLKQAARTLQSRALTPALALDMHSSAVTLLQSQQTHRH